MNQRNLPLPKHIGIIMDGNGRWAEDKGLPRIKGHQQGAKAVREITERAAEYGISHLTLFAFSTENWARPQMEVDFLMRLFHEYLKGERAHLMKNQIRLILIGRRDRLPKFILPTLEETLELTKNNQKLTLCLAVDYGSRDEILRATQKLAQQVQQGQLQPEAITPELFEQQLDTHGLPELDLVIRTSGELRLSNFLLWQAAYAEFYFSECLWPDFDKNQFDQALEAFQKRIRRKGKINA